MTDGEKVLAFVEKYLRVPDGRLVGEPVQLLPLEHTPPSTPHPGVRALRAC